MAPPNAPGNSEKAKLLNVLDMVRLDATGLACPLPILRARRVLNDMADGDILEVRANDTESIRDFPAFCQSAGHHLLMAREENKVYIFEIKKGSRPID